MGGSRTGVCAAIVVVGRLVLGDADRAAATCNVIPELNARFVSTLGDVSTPFAEPGHVVTVHRLRVFASDPTRNLVTLDFHREDGSTTTVADVEVLAPDESSDCKPSRDCPGLDLCTCVRFRFPDTDALADPPGDGRPLTGPVDVRVETDGAVTAEIGPLLDTAAGTGSRTDLPHFLALPPLNSFADLVGEPADPTRPCGFVPPRPGPLLATLDDAGNLYVPLDMSGVRPSGKPPQDYVVQSPIVEAHFPGLSIPDSVDVQLLSTDGHRLPSLIRRAGAIGFVGIADGPQSVLRVDHGGVPGVFRREGGRGPVVIPGVEGFADPCKRGDASSAQIGERMIVYENDECSPLVLPGSSYCEDLNGDGDTNDHFVRALDMTVPNADPIAIDEIDDHDPGGPLHPRPDALAPQSQCGYFLEPFQLPLGVPGYGLYRLIASDDLAAFMVTETVCFDLDGNGRVGDRPVRLGAFDIGRGERIWPAEGTDDIELAGDVLAFTASGGETGHGLYVYDAKAPAPGPTLVREPSNGALTPFDFSAVPWGYYPSGQEVFDERALAVHGRRVAFVVNLAGGSSHILYLYDVDAARLVDLDPSRTVPFTGRIALSDRWLAAETVDRGVLVYDVNAPTAAPHAICAGGAFYAGPFARAMSDFIVPCVYSSALHAYLPFAPDGAREVSLGLTVTSGADVQVHEQSLVTAVAKGADPGGGFFGAFGVHEFDARTRTVTDLGIDVLYPRAPFLEEVQDVLVVVSPGAIERTGRIGFTIFPRAAPPPPPGNDECASAVPITATPFSAGIDTSTALTPVDDPFLPCIGGTGCNDGRGHGSVWYSFTSPVAGTLTVDATGSGFPAVVNVVWGTCSARNQVACGAGEPLTVEVAGGFTYHVELTGTGCEDAGQAALDVTFVPRSTTTTLVTTRTTTVTSATAPRPTTTSTTTPVQTTTSTRPDCAVDAECVGAPACQTATCVRGTCIYAVDGFDGVACMVQRTVAPPACEASPMVAQALTNAAARASRLVAHAGRETRPRRQRRLVRRADRALVRLAGTVARLERRGAIGPACEHDTLLLITTLSSAVESL